MLQEIIRNNRSYRRFFQDHSIGKEVLHSLIDSARLTPSGGNKQVLRYYWANEQALNEQIFSTLGWAGYLPQWPGPNQGERPTAYIVILESKDNQMATTFDCGIAAQTILLSAVEIGLGGCMIGNVAKDKLRNILGIDEKYEILLVIALGKPKETIVIDEIDNSSDIKYWRDHNAVHHVPKIRLQDIILNK